MNVFQSPTVSLEYNQPKNQLIQIWKGFSSSEDFREAIDKSVDFTKKAKVKCILSDTLEQSVVKPEDTQYAASVMPKLFMNGVKAMAFVIPKNALTQMSLNKFDKENKANNVKFFASINEAQKWLDTVL